MCVFEKGSTLVMISGIRLPMWEESDRLQKI